MLQIWSTEGLTPARQFTAWRDRLGSGRNPARADRRAQEDAPFPASTRLARLGSSDMLTVRAPAHRLDLRARDGLDAADAFLLYVFSPGFVATSGQIEAAPARSVVLVDPGIRASFTGETEVHYCSLRLPGKAVALHLERTGWRDRATTLRAADPVGALASDFTATLLARADALDAAQGDALVATLCSLIAVGVRSGTPKASADCDAVRAARLGRLKRLIAKNLADPDLSPASVAAVLRVSPRTVHVLFQGSGTTFSEYVTRCRLDACRMALCSSGKAQSVADLAFAWGFGNVSTFYRAFRATFGVTPTEARARGGAPGQFTRGA